MKKKLLFVMESMKSGGGERSLLTLLQLLDYDKYDVDLMLFNPSGLFFGMIPKQVNVLTPGGEYKRFSLPLVQSVKSLVASGKFSLAIKRMLYSRAVNAKDKPSLLRDQLSWKYMKAAFTEKVSGYDAAVGYLEGKPNFFVADCVEAKVKICYIHSDYRKLEMDTEFDEKIFGKINFVVGVSEECVKILQEKFPALADRIAIVGNIISPKVLEKMVQEIPAEFVKKSDEKIILTIGRISAPKGYDIAIDAAEILKKKGYNFKWFSIGTGELFAEFEERIRQKNLQENFVFLGERANPYPYLSACDIYAQPSYFEGKSIALDEAKCFAKPIVATKFTTVYDQLSDGETALLAEIDAASVAEKIAMLFDEEQAKKLSENLKKMSLGNEEEIEKFYALLGEEK